MNQNSSLKKESKKKILSQLNKLKRHDIISVLWEDHAGELGWTTREAIIAQKPYMCRSFGMYLGHDDRILHMASTVEGQGNYNDIQHRLVDAVYKVTKLDY